MATPQPEKRVAPRQAIKIAAKLHTAAGDVSAETRNLSTSGIFLECATEVSEGSPVDIVMILPKEITGDASKWVCCQATVQRVEKNVDGGRYGVAATVKRIQGMPELDWPEVDRRITERRGDERRKSPRAQASSRRNGDRRNGATT
jgi:PilZ domain